MIVNDHTAKKEKKSTWSRKSYSAWKRETSKSEIQI